MLTRLGLTISPEFLAALALDTTEQIVTGGVRGGKTTLLAAKILLHLRLMSGILVWVVGPTYKTLEQIMYYLFGWCQKLGIVARFDTAENEPWRLTLASGTVIETRSAQHPERLASVAPDFIVVDEAGQCDPKVQQQVRARALEKNATIIYGGTIETDDNKPRYAWFETLAVQWMAEPTYNCSAVALPSWSNIAVFNGIDPQTGKVWIDPETGEESGVGKDDFRIAWAREHSDVYTFARIYAGEPIGSPHPAYPELRAPGVERLQELPSTTRWLTHTGGGDWGVMHPWALVVIGVSTQVISAAEDLRGYKRNVCWVRECVWSGKNNGDSQLFNSQKRALSSKYGILRWGVDPVQSSLADNAGTEAVNGSPGSRDGRIGLGRSRLRNGTLMFDLKGAGVPELVGEMRGVHYRLRGDGKFELVRMDDDRTAAFEDALWMIDSAASLPSRVQMRKPKAAGGREFASV